MTLLWGEDFLTETVLGMQFRISPFSFFQTNTRGAEILYGKARDYISLTPGCTVYDLYSGTGTIAQVLAPAAGRIIGVEIVEEAVAAARENAALNGLTDHPIRWITDDAHKFMEREIRRSRRYDAVIFDPPTFGRGANGEMYKIERDLKKTLSLVKELLSEKPLFVLFSSHTPGLSCTVAANILGQAFPAAQIETGEMLLEGRALSCPSGIFCRAIFPA